MEHRCHVDLWETPQHSAEKTILSLSKPAQAKVLALLSEMRSRDRIEIRNLKKTHQDQLWEYRARVPEGGLRVLFAFGLQGKVWCLGAFVKRNDKEGNKLLKHPYEKLAIAASQR